MFEIGSTSPVTFALDTGEWPEAPTINVFILGRLAGAGGPGGTGGNVGGAGQPGTAGGTAFKVRAAINLTYTDGEIWGGGGGGGGSGNLGLSPGYGGGGGAGKDPGAAGAGGGGGAPTASAATDTTGGVESNTFGGTGGTPGVAGQAGDTISQRGRCRRRGWQVDQRERIRNSSRGSGQPARADSLRSEHMTKEVQAIQVWLNTIGAIHGSPEPKLDEDGIAGRKTMAAIDQRLGPVATDWSDARKFIGIEQWVYKQFHIDGLDIDGLIGEQTRWARTVFASRGPDKSKPNLKEETWRDHVEKGKTPPVITPANMLWPAQSGAQHFYGTPGTGMTMLEMPFPLRIAWEPDQTVRRVSCHAKCMPRLRTIWDKTLAHYGYEELRRLRLDMFGGCVNVRKMRGGSNWSMHAFGCAWDVNPDRNQLKFNRAQATLDEFGLCPVLAVRLRAGGAFARLGT